MDSKYMKRAIDLAKKGSGFTNPNPLVGAVIVKKDRIIGEGYHQFYGDQHAEVNALQSITADATGTTMYVTLEPCSHYGKTPPCVDAIINNKLSKVIIGMMDPNPLVAGRGIEKLRDNGIEVVVGILEEKVKRLNEVFIKYMTTKSPFGILKTAMTLDGKIASQIGDSKWITNGKSRRYVHEIRQGVSSIMVGIGTILADNPRLTTRLDSKHIVDPIRIVVDSTCKIPLDAQVLNLESNARTIIATTEKANQYKKEELRQKGAEIIETPLNKNGVDLKYLCKKLGEKGIDSILIEGGSTLNYSALEEGIVDKVLTFIAPKIIGGNRAKTPVGGQGRAYMQEGMPLNNLKVLRFDEDILIEGYIRKDM